MYKSGLENAINDKHSEGRCPRCKSYITEKLKSNVTNWLCHNNDCSQIVF